MKKIYKIIILVVAQVGLATFMQEILLCNQ